MDNCKHDFHRLIELAGLTAAQVSVLCDVDPRTVRRWLSGSPPGAAHLLLLSVMVEAMADQGKGLAAIQRRLQCGYGVINRLLTAYNERRDTIPFVKSQP